MLGGEKGWGKPNLKSVLLDVVMDRCQLGYGPMSTQSCLSWQYCNWPQLPSITVANCRIDWAQAQRDGSIVNYKQKVSNDIAAHIHTSYECAEDINCELKFITSLLM